MVQDLTRRGLALAVAGLGVTLPAMAASAPPPSKPGSIFDLVDPELRAAVLEPEKVRMPMMREGDIPAFRRRNDRPPPHALADPPFRQALVPGRGGAPAVRVLIVDGGSADRLRPAILHTHGGGYILGSPQADMPNLQRIAGQQRCLIVSVDYRLAPETRFPGSLEDNYAALRWLYDHAEELKVDRSRIVVMGESAGGGHAAALALAARDRGDVPLAGQVLVYAMLDDRTGSARPVPSHQGVFVWTPELNALGWSALLGAPAGAASAPKGAVPARAESLAGLPPTFIGVGALDLFVEEDVDYAKRLLDAGVPTELLVVPGAYHGFQFMVPTAAVSRRFTGAIDGALARMLRPGGA